MNLKVFGIIYYYIIMSQAPAWDNKNRFQVFKIENFYDYLEVYIFVFGKTFFPCQRYNYCILKTRKSSTQN